MQKLITLSNSPFKPNLEIFDDMVIKLDFPYSEDEVTVQINFNIVEYQDEQKKEGTEIIHLYKTVPTEETKFLKFDFKGDNVQEVRIANKTYEIKLMDIRKENIQGLDVPYFKFLVKVL